MSELSQGNRSTQERGMRICGCFLGGAQVEKLPMDARERMAERLSKVVSRHFCQHPEEYRSFLERRGKQK